MITSYHIKLSLKTRILNFFRKIFARKLFDTRLRKLTTDKHEHNFWCKIVPPEYLYPAEAFRHVKIDSIFWELNLHYVIDHAIYFGFQEKSAVAFLGLISDKMTVIDVGANIGMFSVKIASHHPSATVYSFEPNSENFKRLQRHIDINKLTNIHPINTGLGAERSIVKLYNVVETNPGMNRILHTDEQLPFEQIEIQVFDDWKEHIGLGKVDVIKIDTEGFEMEILTGMRNTLKTDKPILFIEVDDENLKGNSASAKEMFSYLGNFGYRLVNAEDGTPAESSISSHFDCICYPIR